jgi:hypothetical protein
MRLMALLVCLTLAPAFASGQQRQPRESTSCQSDIVSATVVATFCGHYDGDALILDLLILWRGSPGWFQRSWMGGGSSGSNLVGRGIAGKVSHANTYGDVTIRFDADFDAGTATVENSALVLQRVNTVMVDGVDGERRIVTTRWTAPALPFVADGNLALARRSREFVRDLQCEIPMPKPHPMWRVPVVTVCERMKTKK